MAGITRNLKTQGLVLRYTNFREADRMITLFSPDLGKISVMARGCRKTKSRFLTATELFAYGEYVLYRKGDFYIMTQANVLETFYEIRKDMDRLIYGSYILDLTEEVVSPGQEDGHLFYLLLQILSYLSYSNLDPEDITHVYEVKLLDHLGYMPLLKGCMACGANEGPFKFDILEGGLLCRSCQKNGGMSMDINMGTIKTMDYIPDMDIKRLNTLKVSEPIREELDKVLSAYIRIRLDKKLKTRTFIEEFNRGKGIN